MVYWKASRPAAGPHDGLQDEAARSAALAELQHGQEWKRNGQDSNRTEQTEQTDGTNTETATCTKWLAACAACRLFVLCLAASLPTKDNSGAGSTWRRRPPSKKAQVSWSTEIDVCETLDIARRSHGHDHGSREGRLVQVVLTGGTRLGRSLIRRLVELNHDQSAILDESRVGPAGQPGLLVVRLFGR